MKRLLLLILPFTFLAANLEAQVYGQPIVIWDFAEGIPSDWIVGINSTTDLAHWEYRGPNTVPNYTVGARGTCSAIAQPLGSVTQSNGFVIFDSNYWDDSGTICGAAFGSGVDPAPHIAWLITNPVDMSTVTSAVLTFQQQYRHYQSTTKVQLSTDGGENWTDIVTNPGPQSPNTIWTSANITALAAGQPDVRFRFIFEGTYYWWLLDDITVYQPNANDLMMTSKAYTNNTGPESLTANFNLEYDQYPLSMIPTFNFKAGVQNVGANAQTGVTLNATIVKDGTTEVYNNNSNPINVNSSQTANLNIPGVYTNAAVTGDYDIFFTISQNETDDNLSNNEDSLDYSITSYAYAKDEGPMENTYVQNSFYDTYRMVAGNFYQAFNANQYCHSLQVGVAEGTAIGKEIRGAIYNQAYDSLLAETEIYVVNAGDLNSPGDEKMVVLDFPSPFAMQDDSLYFVVISEVDSIQPFQVARSGNSFAESSLIRYPGVNATFISAKSVMVRMNLFPLNAQPGCTDPLAMNFDSGASTEDGSCRYPGCTNELADNYDPDANFDTGICVIGGCMDPDASNYNSLVTYDNGSCLYPGCLDPTALNFDAGANIDNGTCTYLFTALQVDNLSGCPPLTINVNNQNIITENSTCEYLVNSNVINEACEQEFTYTFTEAGNYQLTYTITVGNAVADTTINVTVFELPEAPDLTYNGFGLGISCNNCGSNHYEWYLDDEYLEGNDDGDLSIVVDDVHQNGDYMIMTINEFGCSISSDIITVVQPYFATSVTDGCAPFAVTFTDLTDPTVGLENTLNTGVGNPISNFSGSTVVNYDTPGTYVAQLTSTLGNASGTFSVDINVYGAETPTLVNNEANNTIDCTNCDQFETIEWNVDGNIIAGGNSQPSGGNLYGISVATAEGCSATALLIVASTRESEANSFMVYPNPVSDMLHLNADQAFTFEVCDMTSRRIDFPCPSSASSHTLDMRQVPSGQYYIILRNEFGTSVKKIGVVH